MHGEYRMLVRHSRLAIEMGVAPDEVLICEDGDVVQLGDEGIDFAGEVSAAHVFVDGIVGDVGVGVLRDRRVLAEEGVVVAVVTIDSRSGEIVGLAGDREPRVSRRARRRGGGRRAARRPREGGRGRRRRGRPATPTPCGGSMRRTVGRIVSDRTRRRPMIVPVVLEA